MVNGNPQHGRQGDSVNCAPDWKSTLCRKHEDRRTAAIAAAVIHELHAIAGLLNGVVDYHKLFAEAETAPGERAAWAVCTVTAH